MGGGAAPKAHKWRRCCRSRWTRCPGCFARYNSRLNLRPLGGHCGLCLVRHSSVKRRIREPPSVAGKAPTPPPRRQEGDGVVQLGGRPPDEDEGPANSSHKVTPIPLWRGLPALSASPRPAPGVPSDLLSPCRVERAIGPGMLVQLCQVPGVGGGALQQTQLRSGGAVRTAQPSVETPGKPAGAPAPASQRPTAAYSRAGWGGRRVQKGARLRRRQTQVAYRSTSEGRGGSSGSGGTGMAKPGAKPQNQHPVCVLVKCSRVAVALPPLVQ